MSEKTLKVLRTIGFAAGAIALFYLSQFFLSILLTAFLYTKFFLDIENAYAILTIILESPDIIMALTMFSDFLAFILILGFGALLNIKNGHPMIKETFAFHKLVSKKSIPLLILFGFLCNFLVIVLWDLIPFPQSILDKYEQVYAQYEARSFLLSVIPTIIAAPLCEEILCRGSIQYPLSKIMPKWLAIVLASAIFGLLHGNLYQGTYAFFIGVIMGIIFEVYHSLFATIIFHASFNLTSFIIEWMSSIFSPVIMSILYYVFSVLSIFVFALIVISTKNMKESHPIME